MNTLKETEIYVFYPNTLNSRVMKDGFGGVAIGLLIGAGLTMEVDIGNCIGAGLITGADPDSGN